MTCPRCAGSIVDGSMFCGICGARIDVSRPVADTPPPPGPPPPGPPPPGPPPPGFPPPGPPLPGVWGASAASRTSLGSEPSSLFELPAGSRRGRAARVAVVLALDLILAGAGIAMGLSWWRGRATSEGRTTGASSPSGAGASDGDADHRDAGLSLGSSQR